MDELVFNDEGISFKFLSNWREQKKEMNGPNCIKALVKVVNGNPATITIYKNPEESENVEDLEEPMKKAFNSQGWEIVHSEISNFNDIPVMNLIAKAEQSGKTLELHTFSTLKNGFMYVFELMAFEGSKFAINDFLAILESVSFDE